MGLSGLRNLDHVVTSSASYALVYFCVHQNGKQLPEPAGKYMEVIP